MILRNHAKTQACIIGVLALLRYSAANGGELEWMSDLEKAKSVAVAQKKDLLINFTGLKWCLPCRELENILANQALAPIGDSFVLVRLDFPANVERLSQEPQAPQPSWKSIYGVRVFPTVFLADATGTPYAVTGNNGMKPPAYFLHLQELQSVHQSRDKAFSNAANANGVQRATILAEGLRALEAGFSEK